MVEIRGTAMRKIGDYLLTAVPLIAGLGIQIICSMTASLLYGIYYGVRAASGTDAAGVSHNAILAGYNSIVIYVLILSQIIAFIVFGIWYSQQNRGREIRSLTQAVHVKTLESIVFLGIGLQLLTNLFMQAVYLLAPAALEQYSRLVETVGIGQTNMTSLLATVILAPVVEEIMFRGVTMRLARKAGAGFIIANLIQAVAFGIYHLNWIQGVYAMFLGLVLGYMAYRYDSIYPSILLHLAYNFSATLVGAAAEGIPDSIITQIVIVVVTVVTIYFGIRFLKEDRMNKESLN